ncbi:hypothetical protein SK128_009760 [Halocaridina rubra]|uniref:Methyltransferase FkbM domain-containing protein n=1 Tax=Halocaridina rubra TaxID=373956 RepID=A0AAN8X317_HALRR
MRKPNTKIEALKSRLSMLSNSKKDEKPVITVQTLPLYSILKALNVTVVDFLSLDIEGYEVKILKTLPWDKVKFRLMCIEINHVPEGVHHLVKYLKGKGYQFLGKNIQDAWFGWPELLRKKSCAAC